MTHRDIHPQGDQDRASVAASYSESAQALVLAAKVVEESRRLLGKLNQYRNADRRVLVGAAESIEESRRLVGILHQSEDLPL